MTTDRPAAPTRSNALADRPAAGGRTQAPPSDAFSTLLGAVAPKSDAPARRDERPVRRDETPRWDEGPRGLERRPPQPKHDDYRRPDSDAKAAPATGAVAASSEPEAPAETPAAPVTPALFTLQLASPLPPVPAVAAAAVMPVAPAPPTPAEGAPVLPILSGIVPASVATATATAPIAGEVPAAAGEPAATAAVAASLATTTTTTTSTPVTGQPAEGDVTLPENLVKPQAAAAAPAAPATPAAQAAQAQNAASTAGQQQPGSDAHNPGQPNTPTPAPTVVPGTAATPPKVGPVAEAAPAALPVTPTVTSAPVVAAAFNQPAVERAVPLSRAVATTGMLLHLASERGVTHARLNLKPVELGGIEVKLLSTPAGIHAQLVADSPEAARMLSQAGEDLRRQLEARDVNLLSLDVSTSSDQRDERPGFSADGFGEDRRPGSSAGAIRGVQDTVLMEAPAGAETVLVLPDGVHVDVLA